MCRQLKIGLSAWGNAQAWSHYQTKLSPDVGARVFPSWRKAGRFFSCHWRLESWLGAQRPGDYGEMSLSSMFSSFISLLCYFFFYYITQFPLRTKIWVCLFFLFLYPLSGKDALLLSIFPFFFLTQKSRNNNGQQYISSEFSLHSQCFPSEKHHEYCAVPSQVIEWWSLSTCRCVP